MDLEFRILAVLSLLLCITISDLSSAEEIYTNSILVAIRQDLQEGNYFIPENGKIISKDNNLKNIMTNYNLSSFRKLLHKQDYALYQLTFPETVDLDQVCRLLSQLTFVISAEKEPTIKTLTSPNDYYYNNNFWVPDSLEEGVWFWDIGDCTVFWNFFAYPDNSESNDNWYLNSIQADKAWEIEKGSEEIIIAIIDTGVDWEHPDLNDNIWTNEDEHEGDYDGNGLPGGSGDDDNDGYYNFNDQDICNRDFDWDLLDLDGEDGVCDAGPDGDYGFGPNGIDDYPDGPGGGDDDTLVVDGYDAWDDNLKGPTTPYEFDDDMDDIVRALKDDDENGYQDDFRGWDWWTWAEDEQNDPCHKGCDPPLYIHPDPGCHGTSMAGIAAAETNNTIGMAGVAWNCKIMALKAFGGGPLGVGNACQALEYAMDQGAHIVNMSWTIGGDSNSTLHYYIEEAYNHGLILVAAAGNRNAETYYYPACWPEVIAVSGVNQNDQKTIGQRGTNYNDRIEVCGVISDRARFIYGMDAVVTGFSAPPYPRFDFPGASLPHDYVNTELATSGASAQVSGVAALLRSMYPDSSNEFIRSEIHRGAVPVDNVEGNENSLWEGKLGYGRLNPYRSMTQWGKIKNDTTWANFAYVSGDVEVEDGVTLTIEPGTSIYFAAEDNDNLFDSTVVEFRINGELNAAGSYANPIEFKSLAAIPQPGDWSGIQFFGNNSSGSLSYCNISHAYHGIKSYAPIDLSNCTISNCEVHGVYIQGDLANGIIITDCTANNNGDTGILISACDSALIEVCEADSNYYGVWISLSDYNNIENTNMKSNTNHGVRVSNTSSCAFDSCTIEDNEQHGMYLAQASGTISNTKIGENEVNGLYCIGSSANPEVDHSKFELNYVGVKALYGASPVLGDINAGKGMQNSICYNDSLHVSGSSSYTIMAEKCWWGTEPPTPPDTSKFEGNVDYNPYLQHDPVLLLAPRSKTNNTVLSLAQSFPNPSTPGGVTTIRYSIPSENERVILRIYDVNGRRLKTLVNRVQPSGHYTVKWDGRNDRGAKVATGIYFYQLKVGKKSLAKKLVLFQ